MFFEMFFLIYDIIIDLQIKISKLFNFFKIFFHILSLSTS